MHWARSACTEFNKGDKTMEIAGIAEIALQVYGMVYLAVCTALYGGLVLFVVLGIPYVCLKTLLKSFFQRN